MTESARATVSVKWKVGPQGAGEHFSYQEQSEMVWQRVGKQLAQIPTRLSRLLQDGPRRRQDSEIARKRPQEAQRNPKDAPKRPPEARQMSMLAMFIQFY